MKAASSVPKPRRRPPSKREDLAARVAELTVELKGMKKLLKRTFELVQKGQDERRTLADVDPEDDEAMDRYEERVLERAGTLLAREMKALRDLGIVDEKGKLNPPAELPVDMREESTCDV